MQMKATAIQMQEVRPQIKDLKGMRRHLTEDFHHFLILWSPSNSFNSIWCSLEDSLSIDINYITLRVKSIHISKKSNISSIW